MGRPTQNVTQTGFPVRLDVMPESYCLLRHGEESRRISDEKAGARSPGDPTVNMFDPSGDMVMGHEFCCKVVGPNEESAIRAWRRIDGVEPLVALQAVGVPGMIEHTMRNRQGTLAAVRVRLLTGTVGIDDIPRAFADLGNPEAHAKIFVQP